MEPQMVRQLWQLIEPVHAAGLLRAGTHRGGRGPRPGHGRALAELLRLRTAPLGRAGPELAFATYYSFSPAMIAEYVPAVWSVADPAKVLDARLSGRGPRLRALLGDRVDPELAEAAELARRAAEDATWPAGRSPPPTSTCPGRTSRTWCSGTPPRCCASTAATGTWRRCHRRARPDARRWSPSPPSAPRRSVFGGRGWTEEEWAAARDRLAARGLVDADGLATDAGRAAPRRGGADYGRAGSRAVAGARPGGRPAGPARRPGDPDDGGVRDAAGAEHPGRPSPAVTGNIPARTAEPFSAPSPYQSASMDRRRREMR